VGPARDLHTLRSFARDPKHLGEFRRVRSPRTAPASPLTRSTRLAAQWRRRRCGSGMGSRVLMSLSPHEPLSDWPRTLLAKVKQQRRALAAFLKSGWAIFSGNRSRKRGPVRRAPCSCHESLMPMIPMARRKSNRSDLGTTELQSVRIDCD
jgi:hypothetical protein